MFGQERSNKLALFHPGSLGVLKSLDSEDPPLLQSTTVDQANLFLS
jgi:hypothetical protein